MNTIDELITVLTRANNCEKVLSNLVQASNNLLFQTTSLNKVEKKYLDHVLSLIKESIEIIKDEKN